MHLFDYETFFSNSWSPLLDFLSQFTTLASISRAWARSRFALFTVKVAFFAALDHYLIISTTREMTVVLFATSARPFKSAPGRQAAASSLIGASSSRKTIPPFNFIRKISRTSIARFSWSGFTALLVQNQNSSFPALFFLSPHASLPDIFRRSARRQNVYFTSSCIIAPFVCFFGELFGLHNLRKKLTFRRFLLEISSSF